MPWSQALHPTGRSCALCKRTSKGYWHRAPRASMSETNFGSNLFAPTSSTALLTSHAPEGIPHSPGCFQSSRQHTSLSKHDERHQRLVSQPPECRSTRIANTRAKSRQLCLPKEVLRKKAGPVCSNGVV